MEKRARCWTLARPGDVVLSAVQNGHGPQNLVLLHGFPLDHTLWNESLHELGAAARVIAPDLRGMGKSGIAGHASMGDHADDIAAWMNEAGMRRATVAALSMGGYVAFELWRRHPERIAALALLNTTPKADSLEARRARIEMREKIQAGGMSAVCGKLIPALLGATARESCSGALQRARQMILSTRPAGAIAALDAMRLREDSVRDLPTIGVPTLVVVGEEDTLTPPAIAREIASALPRAELLIIPGAGHLTPLEAPGDITRALGRIVERAANAPQ